MNLTTVKELFKNPDQYLDQEITVGGWVRSLRDSKAFGNSSGGLSRYHGEFF